ncbi:hypothetical protein FGO68_gene4996 [Halteria grandinella]|uniref:Uncharacterized protein n=1 Tax=Halteria grandinella TaxID=5974 RepID=A0A8J8NS30_HALGN|nr:hypothetical protein FGO68_gene4996 [Halteria grandinella]
MNRQVIEDPIIKLDEPRLPNKKESQFPHSSKRVSVPRYSLLMEKVKGDLYWHVNTHQHCKNTQNVPDQNVFQGKLEILAFTSQQQYQTLLYFWVVIVCTNNHPINKLQASVIVSYFCKKYLLTQYVQVLQSSSLFALNLTPVKCQSLKNDEYLI